MFFSFFFLDFLRFFSVLQCFSFFPYFVKVFYSFAVFFSVFFMFFFVFFFSVPDVF